MQMLHLTTMNTMMHDYDTVYGSRPGLDRYTQIQK